MTTVFADADTQPLILELLSRRNWFKPKQLEEIEELLRKAKANTLPEVALIEGGPSLRAGDRQHLRRGPVSAGDRQ